METLPFRKSSMSVGKLYFRTATIHNRQRLLTDNSAKQIVVESLSYLSRKGKISVYAFVIMPNHIHLIWQIHEHNGKGTSHASFLKFTAHAFKDMLRGEPEFLKRFGVDARNKQYEFWQRDSLATELYSLPIAVQKLHYIHYNPLGVRLQLCSYPSDYRWSSAAYYDTGEDRFEWLKNLFDYFYG